MEIEVHIEGLDDLRRAWNGTFLARLKRGVRQSVARAVARGEEVAKSHINIGTSETRTGTHLRDETYGRVTGEVGGALFAIEGEIVANKPYAKFVEGGTKEHVVEVKRAPFLVWKDASGGWHRAKKVTIPAIPAHPFMGPAYFATEQRLQAELEKAVEAAVNSFNGT